MPLYEYSCRICLNTFERLRPVSQMNDSTNCPDCGGPSDKQMSVFASFSANADGQVSPIAGGGGGCCGGGAGAGCACAAGA